MLKIKDNIDLKELEKYDFVENLDSYMRRKRKENFEDEPFYITTFIMKEDKHIMNLITNSYTSFFNDEIGLEDIIDLVEKIGE